MSSESLWSIYNRAEEVRLDGLQAFQLKAMLECFAPVAFSKWLIWQEGWVDWQELDAVVDSLFPGVRSRSASVIAKTLPPPPPPIAHTPPAAPVLSLVDAPMPSASSPLKQQERRANSRHQVPIKVFLHIEGSVQSNETLDISLGGMRLKNQLNKDPKSSFDVTMLHNGTELALRCRLLAVEGEQPRTRLLIEKCNRIEILRSWIVEPKKESA